jgi:UDPglucose 6-dehydrogenase
MQRALREFNPLRLVYMPEFLRERSSFVWFVNPDRIVVSGDATNVEEALSYFYWVENAEVLRMDHRSAEIGKLAHNAFIATKVSFTNEIESICDDLGGNPTNVMSVIWADRRVKSQEHLRPHIGPYGGKCVLKDTRELLHSSSKSVLLKTVESVNVDTQQRYSDGDE